MRTYAKLLGQEDAAATLQETLNEEKETDSKLTGLAESINVEAMNSSDSDDTSEKPKIMKRAAGK